MLKKSLIGLALIAMLAVAAQAGEAKWHGDWPGHWVYDSQSVCTINVLMDIGLYVHVCDQDPIKLDQIDIHTYQKCKTIHVDCNFNVLVSCSVASTGAVTGDFSCWINGGALTAPGGDIELCVKAENVDLMSGPGGGTTDVHVATVTISVVPN